MLSILFWSAFGSIVLYFVIKATIIGVREFRKDAYP